MPKINLTERFCESTKAEGQRTDYLDARTPGLYFRVTPGGVKSWSLLYTDKRTGKKRRLDLGRYIGGQDDVRVEDREGVTLSKARQLAKEHIADIGKGADPARDVTLRRESITFRVLAEKKLAKMGTALGGRPRRSVTNYRSMLERHVYPEIGDLKASDVCWADIERVLDKVANSTDGRFKPAPPSGVAKPTRMRKAKGNPRILAPGRKVSHQPNRVFEMLRSIMRFGRKNRMLPVNPMELMSPPIEKEEARKQHLSIEKIPPFWKSLEAAPITRQLQLAMLLEIVLGQRTGELIRRKKSDIDRSGPEPVLRIPEDETKNGFPHRVPLSPLAMRLINEAMAIDPDSKFIFPSPFGDAPLTPASATRAMGRLRPNLEASDLRVHDLRRTASNGMRKLGVPKFIVSVVLNHVSVTKSDVTSEHYLDEFAFEVEKTEALMKWGAKLDEALVKSGVLSPLVPNKELAENTELSATLSTGMPTIRPEPDATGSLTIFGAGPPTVRFAPADAIDQDDFGCSDASGKKLQGHHAESNRRQVLRRTRMRRLRLGARPASGADHRGGGISDGADPAT